MISWLVFILSLVDAMLIALLWCMHTNKFFLCLKRCTLAGVWHACNLWLTAGDGDRMYLWWVCIIIYTRRPPAFKLGKLQHLPCEGKWKFQQYCRKKYLYCLSCLLWEGGVILSAPWLSRRTVLVSIFGSSPLGCYRLCGLDQQPHGL
jgi:hypothetical protein